jgi:hypothetical protein
MKTLIAGSNGTVGSAVTLHLMIRKILLVCGILSSLIWLGTDIFASLRYQGYNYPFQPISGLSAIGAPTRPFVVPLDSIYSVLKIAFAVGVWMFAGQKRSLRITAGLLVAFGVVDMVANFFPMHPAEALGTLANVMHSILAGGAGALLILLTIGFGASADGKWFGFYSYGTLLVLILIGVIGALPFFDAPRIAANQALPWIGAGERINAYGYMIWMTALAIVLLRIQPISLRREDRENLVDPGAAISKG